MKELVDTAVRAERAFIVGVRSEEVDRAEAESLAKELKSLAETLKLEVVGSIQANIRERHAAFLLGDGKVKEVIEAAKAAEADTILFDCEITPRQQRNWEKESELNVLDRHELIIRIFDARALTREAALQVELAQLEYALPRLSHSYEALSRQRGGHYGTKGKGEQKLELDRRSIKVRIRELKEEIEKVRVSRLSQRKRRERLPVSRAAIVGYTNAGKSATLNALCAAQALVEDKLFATLDTTTRRVRMGRAGNVLLTDTVGFVRNLPHDLVDAFAATLEEAADADALVHVLDASDPEIDSRKATTEKVLAEIGATGVPVVLALNKWDLVDGEKRVELAARFPDALPCSARTGEGLDALADAVADALSSSDLEFKLEIPDAEYKALVELKRYANVLSEERTDFSTIVVAKVPERFAEGVRKYSVG
jgi:GTP-binding protein HflX